MPSSTVNDWQEGFSGHSSFLPRHADLLPHVEQSSSTGDPHATLLGYEGFFTLSLPGNPGIGFGSRLLGGPLACVVCGNPAPIALFAVALMGLVIRQ